MIKRDLNASLELLSQIKNNNFYTILFTLFFKADKDNYEVLKSAFPEEEKVFEQYKKYGLDLGGSEIIYE